MLVALRYYAKGGFLSELARIHGISKSSVCRIIKKVSSYIAALAPLEMSFPDDEYVFILLIQPYHVVIYMILAIY